MATVTLLVGKTKTAFQVHESDLFEESSFFKTAFTSEFLESSERTMTLPEDDAATFELFVDWLYHRRRGTPSFPISDGRIRPFVELNILADKYDVPNLRSFSLSEIFSNVKSRKAMIQLPTITYAYEHTSQNAAIRRILSDYLACHCGLSWYQREDIQEWFRAHSDISADVICSLAKHTKGRDDPFDGDMPKSYMETEIRSSD